MRGIYQTQMRAQMAFDIPLAVKGTSHRTEEHISKEYFLPGDINFIENVLKNSELEKESETLLRQMGLFRSPKTIQLPEYIDWDYNELYDTIKNELKWKEEKEEDEHGDCLVSNIVDYIRQRKFPILVPELLRYSKLVTCGQLTKEEARKKVSNEIKEIQEPKNLQWFLDELGITQAEMDKVLEDPMRHMKYLKERSRIVRRLKAMKKKRIKLI